MMSKRSARSSRAVTSAPPTTSLCPLRYLVVECTTRSTPSASGRWKYGLRKVLSATVSRPCSRPMATIARMSTMCSSGLLGVSIHSIRVSGRTAARTAVSSLMSTNENAMPNCGMSGLEQPVGAAVDVVAGDHVVALPQQEHGSP